MNKFEKYCVVIMVLIAVFAGSLEIYLLTSETNATALDPKMETVVETTEVAEPVVIPAETLVPAETTEPPIDQEALEMLALIIYQEAGGDDICDECRYRVADVVLNRVADERFPNTIEEVLLHPGQYGLLSWTGLVWPEKASYDCEKHAVERAYAVAEDVLRGHHSELYGEGYIWQAEFHQGYDEVYCCGIYFGK